MEQRPLRLGDIVDDYCPRERRITNHTIVALVGDEVRQTRCTTCDADHVYKEAREPKRRRKDGEDERIGVVGQLVAPRRPEAEAAEPEAPLAAASPADPDAAPDASSNGDEPPAEGGAWFGHRRLIRATLPRTEGEPPAPRPIPEFTMHQRQPPPRGRGFRDPQHGGGWGGGAHARQNGNGF